VNCVEDKLTESGLKWPKEKKRWSKVREIKMLDEEIEDDRSARNMDRGKLRKWKNPPMDALEHLVGNKERQVGEALKMWVKLT
jgi:hypothetical protein